jgi:hypothetical protein
MRAGRVQSAGCIGAGRCWANEMTEAPGAVCDTLADRNHRARLVWGESELVAKHGTLLLLQVIFRL